MNYELAKQLKDAGFPQTLGDRFFYTRRNSSDAYQYHFGVLGPWESADTEHAIVVPTLEELIDAIPHDLKLQRIRHDKPECTVIALHMGAPFAVGRGDTLHLAAANCWLALNKY